LSRFVPFAALSQAQNAPIRYADQNYRLSKCWLDGFRRWMEKKMNLNPSKDEIDYINKSLEEYNNKIVGPDNHELLNAVLTGDGCI
jgi:hypothetical protein